MQLWHNRLEYASPRVITAMINGAVTGMESAKPCDISCKFYMGSNMVQPHARGSLTPQWEEPVTHADIVEPISEQSQGGANIFSQWLLGDHDIQELDYYAHVTRLKIRYVIFLLRQIGNT